MFTLQTLIIDPLVLANLLLTIILIVMIFALIARTEAFKTQLTVFAKDVDDIKKTAQILEKINARIPSVADITTKIAEMMPTVASEIFKKTIMPFKARMGQGVQGTIKQILQAKNPVYGELYKQAPKFVKDWIA